MGVKVVLFSTNLLLLFMGFSVLHNAAKSKKLSIVTFARLDEIMLMIHDPQICAGTEFGMTR